MTCLSRRMSQKVQVRIAGRYSPSHGNLFSSSRNSHYYGRAYRQLNLPHKKARHANKACPTGTAMHFLPDSTLIDSAGATIVLSHLLLPLMP